jgi:hypothetical protein
MNSTAETQQQDPNGTEGATQQVTIQPTQADSLRTKNLDTHPCITIKWSLDSDCRRSADVPPVAASAAVAAPATRVGGGSC